MPILLAVGNFTYSDATALSFCCGCGNVLSQLIINFKRHHPLSAFRPIIYYELVAILIPSQLGGNNIGVLLINVLPTSVLMILAVLVLAVGFTMTMKKGIQLSRLESLVNKESARTIRPTPSMPLVTITNPMSAPRISPHTDRSMHTNGDSGWSGEGPTAESESDTDCYDRRVRS